MIKCKLAYAIKLKSRRCRFERFLEVSWIHNIWHSWGPLRALLGLSQGSLGSLEAVWGGMGRRLLRPSWAPLFKKTGRVNQFSPTLRGSERASWGLLGLLLSWHAISRSWGCLGGSLGLFGRCREASKQGNRKRHRRERKTIIIIIILILMLSENMLLASWAGSLAGAGGISNCLGVVLGPLGYTIAR